MKTLQPVLFVTADAPLLGMTLAQAAAIQTAHFAHVQAHYLDRIGQTYSLRPSFAWRGRHEQHVYVLGRGPQFSIFMELDMDGVLDVGDTETAFYVQVWGPEDTIDGLGMCDSRWWTPTRTPYAPRFMDAPSCVKDLLGLTEGKGAPANKFGSWSLQAKGRIEHEIAHHRTGENIRWWDYPESAFTVGQLTALRGSPWLWVR